ncbi:hypothetical protein Sipo8835_25115 [Streptomyces ipomoeae]|uniref:Uncharacterized protein n=1 Tax=Streptomyces ipomoeae TaxID=103232 RepID=A0AAE8W153_9ACTN|nr:hypothetical protein Sipo7851_44110 [Streptomyces ipomoeae]TQE29306.1 hypothetical protein Sipo8835_25115 [Streptomyces ipomoeae]
MAAADQRSSVQANSDDSAEQPAWRRLTAQHADRRREGRVRGQVLLGPVRGARNCAINRTPPVPAPQRHPPEPVGGSRGAAPGGRAGSKGRRGRESPTAPPRSCAPPPPRTAPAPADTAPAAPGR